MRPPIALFLLATLPLAAEAAESDRLPRTSSLVPGQQLVVVYRDGALFPARLLEADAAGQALRVRALQDSSEVHRIPFARIRELRWEQPGRVRFGAVLGGFLLGSLAGALVGNAVDPPDPDAWFDVGGAPAGAVLGALLGGSVGGLLSASSPSKRRIVFPEPPADTSLSGRISGPEVGVDP